ncbi:DUF4256 domain-containing protein [Acholeplasma granularum]|uniref:DUF4256 domain-containing protein n=1 Tax=Acholeplasma granularum TaxID=264635 RepID=UPI0004B2F696|nr:DUF4256 domain-containing protein [Acholeplasma granularum]
MNEFLKLLETRFKKNMHRHEHIKWHDIEEKLTQNKKILETLYKMELTGGEPDLMSYDNNLYYVDFSKETPLKRRSYCYDEKALKDRKKFKPESSVETEIKKLGINLVDENMYFYIQTLEDLDLKTSSWIHTPESIRKLGGALNAEKRYDRTFIFHNGADSYYASRGFRGYIKL